MKINSILIKFFAFTILASIFVSCNKKPKVVLDSDEIKNVCNMALLECYYHNNAKLNKTTSSIISTERTVWMDYDAKIKVGIDASKIDITVNGRYVTVKIPSAKVLQRPNIDPDSFKFFASEGEKTKIPQEELLAAKDLANKAMQDALKVNSTIMSNAEERARKIIESYIKEIGKLSGVDYAIIWEKLEPKEVSE